jgi:hypothetical protein
MRFEGLQGKKERIKGIVREVILFILYQCCEMMREIILVIP